MNDMNDKPLKTYRVKVRVSGTRTYEVRAYDEDDAIDGCGLGVLVYDDVDYDDIEDVVQTDSGAVVAS